MSRTSDFTCFPEPDFASQGNVSDLPASTEMAPVTDADSSAIPATTDPDPQSMQISLACIVPFFPELHTSDSSSLQTLTSNDATDLETVPLVVMDVEHVIFSEAQTMSLPSTSMSSQGVRQDLQGDDVETSPVFQCLECRLSFPAQQLLLDHLGTHTEEHFYSCNRCGKTFTASSTFNQHVQIHARQKHFKCAHCSKCFQWLYSLRCHEITHTRDKPFKCDVCSKQFLYERALRRHMKKHTKFFRCEQCETSFINLQNMQRHQDKFHAEKKPFSCEKCDKTYATASNLRKHKCINDENKGNSNSTRSEKKKRGTDKRGSTNERKANKSRTRKGKQSMTIGRKKKRRRRRVQKRKEDGMSTVLDTSSQPSTSMQPDGDLSTIEDMEKEDADYIQDQLNFLSRWICLDEKVSVVEAQEPTQQPDMQWQEIDADLIEKDLTSEELIIHQLYEQNLLDLKPLDTQPAEQQPEDTEQNGQQPTAPLSPENK